MPRFAMAHKNKLPGMTLFFTKYLQSWSRSSNSWSCNICSCCLNFTVEVTPSQVMIKVIDVKAGSGVYGGKEPFQRALRLPFYRGGLAAFVLVLHQQTLVFGHNNP